MAFARQVTSAAFSKIAKVGGPDPDRLESRSGRVRSSPAMPRCTSTREPVQQNCPFITMDAVTNSGTKASKSASL
ncbi:hypothetical protein AFM16_37250 [Streptomyces antibioticus]|uniref:Uncharacterized protein n=1 Tax=Streptomyces antibioticus TaxID=1890 RepID=A0ABX3LFU3_STRAT|nr:hypothetical protein AFM16_37250 [Streptomyces antibioticus]